MGPSNIWAPLGCVGMTADEIRIGRALESAVQDVRDASGKDRTAAGLRVAGLTRELAARMERGGREHLASALEP